MASGNVLEPSWMSQVVLFHLPVDLQPQVNEIKSYCSSIEKTNAKIFSMMDEIDTKASGSNYLFVCFLFFSVSSRKEG